MALPSISIALFFQFSSVQFCFECSQTKLDKALSLSVCVSLTLGYLTHLISFTKFDFDLAELDHISLLPLLN